MTAIIFGVTGQDGSHLADLLLAKGYFVVGVSRRCSVDNTCRIKHLEGATGFKLVQGDPIGCKVTLRRDQAYEF